MLSKKAVLGVLLIFLLSTIHIDSFGIIHSNDSVHDSSTNIILMIGDGMGVNQTVLARLVEYGTSGNLSMETAQERLNVTTYSANSAITDSAAAATAIATGTKTNNGMLSIAPNGTILRTILEIAEYHNKSTGLLATSEIQHATPAAFMTHVTSRSDYSEITRQIVEEAEVEILLGGGSSSFTSAQLDIMKNRGYTLVQNRSAMLSANESKLLGLFSSGHLPYEHDRDFDLTPSLSEMTTKALQVLDKDPDGFFLMVEGSRIDHAGHANDAIRMALDTIAFDEAVKVALNYTESHPNTMLIVTADHETGGLSVISHTLSNQLPGSILDFQERLSLRIERAQNVSVSWSTKSHTSTNVPIFLSKPDTCETFQEEIIDNTQIFDIMQGFFKVPLSTSTSTTSQTTTIETTNPPTTTTSTTSTTNTDSLPNTATSSTTEQDTSPLFHSNLVIPIILIGSIAIVVIFVICRKHHLAIS